MIRVLVLVNGDRESAAALRARAFVERFGPSIVSVVRYRSGSKVAASLRFVADAFLGNPEVLYVVDMAYSGVLAAGLVRLFGRVLVIVDTGDAIHALAKSVAERGALGLWLTDRLEKFGTWVADAIVVRGTRHCELLGEIGKPIVVVQDGVDIASFVPVEDPELRSSIAPNGEFTVGLVGSSVWSDRLGICYGWELVEIVAAMRDRPVVGVMVGSGSGIERLKARCAELGIADRVRFVGFVPYDDLPRYLSVFDVCLSTQTNDVPGNVRTTGKLPLYLAAGGVVLASRVGEAALVLDERQLVNYDGVVDREYPGRVVERIGVLMDDPATRAELIAANRVLARARFDYASLAGRVSSLIETVYGDG